MKNTIEIKIECKGKVVGTLGWFNSIMNESEFVIKETKTGLPGMFLKLKNADKKDGFDYKFICKPWNSNQEDPSCYRENGRYLWVYVVSDEFSYTYGFTDYPLTPACENKVDEMIEQALEKFIEWWEGDE